MSTREIKRISKKRIKRTKRCWRCRSSCKIRKSRWLKWTKHCRLSSSRRKPNIKRWGKRKGFWKIIRTSISSWKIRYII